MELYAIISIFVWITVANGFDFNRLQLNIGGLLKTIRPAQNPPVWQCERAQYRLHIFSTDPLIIYVQSFIQEAEISHLLRPGGNKYEQTPVYNKTHATGIDLNLRDSHSFEPPSDDEVVRCIKERALSFQGFPPFVDVQPPKLQRYGQGDHFVENFDWAGGSPLLEGNTISTFMIYLAANCTGGGTNFPHLSVPLLPVAQREWCEFVDCDETTTGITFKPVAGNAVFWHNLYKNGTGHEGTLHAALPVLSGTKIGLNIWSWKNFDPDWV